MSTFTPRYPRLQKITKLAEKKVSNMFAPRYPTLQKVQNHQKSDFLCPTLPYVPYIIFNLSLFCEVLSVLYLDLKLPGERTDDLYISKFGHLSYVTRCFFFFLVLRLRLLFLFFFVFFLFRYSSTSSSPSYSSFWSFVLSSSSPCSFFFFFRLL